MTFAREVPAEEWPDEAVCPNCGQGDVVEFGYRFTSPDRPMRTSLECRDCGAYSTWRIEERPAPPGTPRQETLRDRWRSP